jgi:hypothetical protein
VICANISDIIDSWALVDDLAQMPKANMCSYCYTTKLSVMQRNPYGIYGTQGYQEIYDTVVKCMSKQHITHRDTDSVSSL